MNGVLFFTLVIILGAALWPKNSYGRSPHHRLRQKQPAAYQTKVFDHQALRKAAVKLKALEVLPPDASQNAFKLRDGDSETPLMQDDVEPIFGSIGSPELPDKPKRQTAHWGRGPVTIFFNRCSEATGLSWALRYYSITLGEHPPLGPD